jgi:cyclomaltodextrinase / maltogenic alpha-amylase / neopullulanase
MTIAVMVLVYCFVSYFGCRGKKYTALNARPSAEWVKSAVIIEVNLRSFSKDGACKSLAAQIPALKKRGSTVVSLMPIHPIGEMNRKGKLGSPYAVKDFYSVNPEFGTLEDFKSLVNTIHQHGLKIVINLVANQAAWDSQLLLEHPNWFVHNEEGAIVSPNADASDVAQIDYQQHEPRKYMIAVMKFWIQEIGIDGFQCRESELVPTAFWEVARTELDKIKPVLMISEGRLPEHHFKAFDVTYSWSMNNAITNIVNGTVPASIINDSLSAELLQFPKGSLHQRFIIAHNKNTGAPDIEKSLPQGANVYTVLSFTLPGVPVLSADCTIGNMNQIDLSNKLYENLSMLRRNHSALREGSYWNVQNSASAHLFSFIRCSGNDSLLIVVNFANEKKEADILLPVAASHVWKDQFSGISMEVKNSRLNVAIAPLGFLVLVPSSEKVML